MLWDKDDNQDAPAEQEVHPLPWEKYKAMIANDVQPATYSSPAHGYSLNVSFGSKRQEIT